MPFIDSIFEFITYFDNLYWGRFGWLLVCASGLYLTIISKGLQFRVLFNFPHVIRALLLESKALSGVGIHPIKLYFASVGGLVGLGNIVGISTALFVGGPGSIIWTMIASVCGMMLKYSEIYLGIKYRIANKHGGFNGGSMYYLQKAFNGTNIASIAAFLICLYGVETYQFLILVDRIEQSFNFNRTTVIAGLLVVTIYTALGGIKRLANICALLMPIFMLSYISFASYVIYQNISLLPDFLLLVLRSAFTGHAAMGGFLGSTILLSAQLGVSKAVYSGDIGVGYDSIVQSETRIVDPKKQASLAIYALFSDAFICLLTNVMLGVTGAWHTMNHIKPSDVVAITLAKYLPYSDLFMTVLFFAAGFVAVISYLAVGVKCASFLKPRYGKYLYLLYAIFAFVLFCNFSQDKVLITMSLISGLLVFINIVGILRLRKEIEF